MRQVISAAPSLDIASLATRLAGASALLTDPSRALCHSYGYQGNANGVFDHSIFLFLADWMRWLWGDTPTEEWDSVLIEALPAVDRSEKIHHVIAALRAAYDGYRWLDTRNAKQVEKIMRDLYREYGCEARVVEVDLGA